MTGNNDQPYITLSKVPEMFSEIASSPVTLSVVDVAVEV